MVAVEDRSAATLIPIIEEYIRPGTVILSSGVARPGPARAQARATFTLCPGNFTLCSGTAVQVGRYNSDGMPFQNFLRSCNSTPSLFSIINVKF